MLALEFPPLSHITNWPEFIGNDTWGINKVVLVYAFAVLFTMVLFTLGNKKQLVPTGAQNLAETAELRSRMVYRSLSAARNHNPVPEFQKLTGEAFADTPGATRDDDRLHESSFS